MTLLAHHVPVSGRTGFVLEATPNRPNGDTLVLVHTAGQSGVQWRHAAQPLADLGYRVLVPDLPGHGHSEPAPAGPVTDLGDYADWLVRLLQEMGIDEAPILVGCSIGGKVAQDLALRHGTRITAAISMCAEAGPGRGKVHALRRELEDSGAPARRDRTHLGTRAVIGRAVSPDRASLIAQMHCREDPEVSNSDLIGWCTHDILGRLPDVQVPMMFVAGSDDLWVDPAAVEQAAAQVPRGCYVLLDGYGHYPMEEMDGFAKVLDNWIFTMKEQP